MDLTLCWDVLFHSLPLLVVGVELELVGFWVVCRQAFSRRQSKGLGPFAGFPLTGADNITTSEPFDFTGLVPSQVPSENLKADVFAFCGATSCNPVTLLPGHRGNQTHGGDFGRESLRALMTQG